MINTLYYLGGAFVFLIVLLPPCMLLLNRKKINQLTVENDLAIDQNKTERAKININTRPTTILTAFFITLTTSISIWAFYATRKMVEIIFTPTETNWIKTDTLKIKSGPAWFYYDAMKGTLNVTHAVTENDKKQLLGLVGEKDSLFSSYSRAIDELVFKSNKTDNSGSYCWLLLLYAIAGVIGVLLRTINNFIGVTCYKNDFNFHLWWPWYLMRPLLGFITGAVVFLLIEGKQLSTTSAPGDSNAITVIVAFLAGFSTDEFYELLRKISKRLFGSDTQKTNSSITAPAKES